MPFLGKTPTVGNFILLDSITVSNTATFALTKDSLDYYPGSAQNMIVSLNGVTQAPLSAYTISDNTITFSSALNSDSDVIDYILVLGDTLNIGRPSDSTVGATQLQDYAVTSVKMSNTGVGAATYGTSTSIPQITIDAAGRITSATGIDRSNQFEDLTVTGNLTVSGNTVTVDAQTLSVEDPLIHLASNNETSDVVDIGFVGHYSNDGGTTKLHTGFFRDASDEQYYLFNGFEDATLDLSNPATTIDRTANTFALADLNIGDLTMTTSNDPVITMTDTGFGQSAVIKGSNGNLRLESTTATIFDMGGSSQEIARFDSSGRFGIGTTPTQRLDVREEKTGGTLLIQVYNTDNSDTTTQTAGLALGPDSRGATARIIAVKENADFSTNAGRDVALTFSSVLNNSPTERMRITSGGNVGVGTDVPNRKLTINQTPPTALGSPMLQVGEATFVASGYYGIGLGYTAASYTNPPTEIAAVSTSSSGGTTADIVFGTRSVTTNTAATERMRITSSGNVAIGNTNATYILDVDVGAPASSDQVLGRFSSQNGIRDIGFVWDDSASTLGVATLTNHALTFHTGGNSNERMRITSGGRVGIGTGGNSLAADFTLMSNANDWPMIFYNTVTGGEYFYAGPTNDNFGSGGGKFVISDDNSSINAFFQYQKAQQHLWLGSYNVKNDHRTILAGKGVESSGVNYGSYGQLEFYANNNYTGSAHRWLLTNAIRANVFGIIRSTDASTSASIGAFGGVTNGTTDFAIDGDGKVGIGTEQPSAPLEVSHTNLGAEPYSGIVVKNTSTSGTYYTGVTADAVGQAHFRFALNGALKWQWRVGSGSGVDRMDLFSWTKGSDVVSILNDGSFCVNTNVTTNYGQTSGTPNMAYKSLSGGTGGSLIVTNSTSSGWALAYFNKYGYSSGTDNRLINWYTNGTSLGSVTTNGSTVTYGGTSDYRRKQNVVSLSNAIDRVKQLNPIRFEWIDQITPGTFDGFLAHEVQEVVPEAVDGVKDAVDEDGEIKPQSMDPGKLVPLLTAALQEAIARIEALESA